MPTPHDNYPGPKKLPFAPTRPLGIALALTLFVLVATNNSGVNLLYLAVGMMVGAILISVFVSSWSLRKLSVERDLDEHAIAGEPVHIEYRFRKTGGIWPTVGLRFREVNPALAKAPAGFVMHLPAWQKKPASSAPVKSPSHLIARSRGIVKLDAIEVSTTFPFGFLRRTILLHVPQELVVYPRIGMLNRYLALEYRESVEAGAMTSNRRGGNDEFYGIREYRVGDNLRAIHWRSSARTGQLKIREMAANAPPQLIIVLNLRTWRKPLARNIDQMEQVERAIELAAALVCYGFYENFAVGLAIAGGDKGGLPPAPHMGRLTRAQLLRQLAVIDPQTIREDVGIEFPNRVASRAQWAVITLHADDPVRDLVPPSGGGAIMPPGAGSGHRTVLALDAPDAHTWVRFLTPEDTIRILRDRST